MRESKKRLVSYIMILALMAVTVLVNDGMAKAATVTGDNAKFQKEGNTYTLTGNIVTNEEVTFDLSNGDDITIDGAGYSIKSKQVIFTSPYNGKGKVTLKNISIESNEDCQGIAMRGDAIDLHFAGTEPIVVKAGAPNIYSTGHGIAISSNNFSSSTITVEEGANVSLYAGDRRLTTGDGGVEAAPPIIEMVQSGGRMFLYVSPNATLTMNNAKYYKDNILQEVGTQLAYSGKYFIPKKVMGQDTSLTFSNTGKTINYFKIQNVTENATVNTDEYASQETSVPKNLLPTMMNERFEFIGYYSDESCTTPLGDNFDFSGANKTVYAKWNQLKAKVSFDSKGGSDVETLLLDMNGKATKPTDPTKSGYTFGGWFKDEACTQAYDFDSTIKEDITLFAKWNKVVVNQPTVTPKPTVSPKPVVSKASYKANSKVLSKQTVSTFKTGELKFSWGKVSGATGYKIYAAKCGSKLKLVKTINGASKTSTTLTKINGKKLSNKASYKVYVMAYKTVLKKTYSYGKSFLTHCAGTNNKKYTNVSSIKAKTTSKTLSVKKTTTMKVTTKKASSKKALLPTSHCSRVRYFSSNDSIATVSASGKVTAKKKGKCTIYAVAMNGKHTTMKITVK